MTLNQAYKHFNVRTPTELGAAIGYTAMTIYAWKNAGAIPKRAQLVIEAITGGKLKAEKKK